MPALFAKQLCVYRSQTGKPNTSDASDQFSVDLGIAMFDALGVAPSARGHEPTGTPFAVQVSADLGQRTDAAGRGVSVVPERRLNQFEQYSHVGALSRTNAEPSPQFEKELGRLIRIARRGITKPPRSVDALESAIDAMQNAKADDIEARRVVYEQIGDESLLGLDVTASRAGPTGTPHLDLGLSLKWTLRTDRAQDCRSQGAKLSNLRRGQMPHFAAVTMEPRPYMLNLLGGGAGEVDCVYHLHLPALTEATESVCVGSSKPRRNAYDTFRRLVDQRRLRDYDELAQFVASL